MTGRDAAGARPVLILGGYGSLGSRVARALRFLHPGLRLIIAGRDLGKAQALAGELGQASAIRFDLDRDDLGLAADIAPGVVVTAARDLSLKTQRYAARQGAAYIALSDGVFELGPVIAGFVHDRPTAPVVLLGHGMGAVPTLAALHAAQAYDAVEAIELGLLFDPADPLGPASQRDMDRIGAIGPAPLLREEGSWIWKTGPQTKRAFAGLDGAIHEGEAVGLVDVLSLAASGAASIRADFAVGETASTKAGGPPSHEVVIEIVGRKRSGDAGRFRYELVDPGGYAALSAKGVAIVVERLAGLDRDGPPKPGLYLPESLVEPAHAMERLGRFGIAMREARAAAR